ncbi:MAG: Flp family type IVb pilin [Hyphomicrobiaceae bacterium]|nr:Flp family type IVb pilin [Hyphomicrobiaceae bacterium]
MSAGPASELAQHPTHIGQTVKKFANCRCGATSIEYGLIAGLISVLIVGALSTSSESLKGAYQLIGSTLGAAISN